LLWAVLVTAYFLMAAKVLTWAEEEYVAAWGLLTAVAEAEIVAASVMPIETAATTSFLFASNPEFD
jgi:hypothetical protein